MDAIDELPLTDSPEVFGLHINADITYQTNTATSILDTILSIQPKDAGGGTGETRESVVFNQAHEMLMKLPPDYVGHEVSIIRFFSFIQTGFGILRLLGWWCHQFEESKQRYLSRK